MMGIVSTVESSVSCTVITILNYKSLNRGLVRPSLTLLKSDHVTWTSLFAHVLLRTVCCWKINIYVSNRKKKKTQVPRRFVRDTLVASYHIIIQTILRTFHGPLIGRTIITGVRSKARWFSEAYFELSTVSKNDLSRAPTADEISNRFRFKHVECLKCESSVRRY